MKKEKGWFGWWENERKCGKEKEACFSFSSLFLSARRATSITSLSLVLN